MQCYVDPNIMTGGLFALVPEVLGGTSVAAITQWGPLCNISLGAPPQL